MPEATIKKPAASDEANVDFWIHRLSELKAQREVFNTHWRAVADLVYPEAEQFETRRTPGEQRRQNVLSSTGSRSLSKFAAGKQALLIPTTQIWHQLKSDNEDLNDDTSVKEFFEKLNAILFAKRQSPRANFYGVSHEGFISDGAFGNDCMFVGDALGGGFHYKTFHISNIWIALNQWNQVDTIINEYQMTAKAADQQWAHLWGSSPPTKIAAALEREAYKLLDFIHVVSPRQNVDPERLGTQRMPWMSLDIAKEDRKLIREGGYFAMPYIYSREVVIPGEVYGRSPAMEVLPELRTVNQMKRTHLNVGERVAAPPILLADDGFGGGARRVNLLANGLNFGALDAQGRKLIAPFETQAKLDLTLDMQREEEKAILDAFGVNLFELLVEDPRSGVTAFEIQKRAEERGMLLSPGINRQQSEKYGPMIERELSILDQQGLMPDVPPIMQEAQSGYEVEYVSPAARLQRAGEVTAIQETMQVMAPLAANDPKQMLLFDAEKVGRLVMEVQGGPSEVLRKPEELEKIFAQMNQEAQQAQLAEALPGVASAAKDGAAAAEMIQGAGGGAG